MKIKKKTKSLTRHCASLSHPPKARSYPIPPSNLNLIPTVACSLLTNGFTAWQQQSSQGRTKNLITAQIPAVNCCLLWLRCTQERVGSKNSDCRVRHRATRVCCTTTTCPLRCPTQSLRPTLYAITPYNVQRRRGPRTTYHLPVRITYLTPTRITYLPLLAVRT